MTRKEPKKLLAEAGFPNGFDTSINCKDDQCELVELYAAYLSAVGIRAEVKQMEAAEHNSMWNQYKWPELAVRTQEAQESQSGWLSPERSTQAKVM